MKKKDKGFFKMFLKRFLTYFILLFNENSILESKRRIYRNMLSKKLN